MSPQPTQTPSRTPPVHEVRLGTIRAAIWANETDSGTWYNVTFERSYRDGDNWKTSASYGRDDLLVLAKVADLAHTWIANQPRERQEVPNDGKEKRKPASLDGGRLPSARGV